MMTEVTGKTVMITGASRGIGEAAARLFAAQGANVVLLARGAEAINTIATEIGETALALACDVSDPVSVENAVREAITAFGGVDILINNAGAIDPIARMDQADVQAWGKTIDINLKGVYHGMRAVLPDMIARGGGTVITISSGAAHNALEGWSAYCASKAAAAMLTMSLDKEYRAQGIRAMGLSPGTVATQMQRDIKDSGVNPVSQLDWSDHIPPEWPAQALLWMCGPEGDAYVGQEVKLRDEDIRRKVGLIS